MNIPPLDQMFADPPQDRPGAAPDVVDEPFGDVMDRARKDSNPGAGRRRERAADDVGPVDDPKVRKQDEKPDQAKADEQPLVTGGGQGADGPHQAKASDGEQGATPAQGQGGSPGAGPAGPRGAAGPPGTHAAGAAVHAAAGQEQAKEGQSADANGGHGPKGAVVTDQLDLSGQGASGQRSGQGQNPGQGAAPGFTPPGAATNETGSLPVDLPPVEHQPNPHNTPFANAGQDESVMPAAQSAEPGGAAPAGQPIRVEAPGFEVIDSKAEAPVINPARGGATPSAAAPAATGQVTAVAAAEGIEARDVTEQSVRALRAAVNQRGGVVTMKLTPAELGTLQIRMEMTGLSVRASFQVSNDSVANLLQQQMSTLKAALEGQGLTVEQIQVHTNQSANQGAADQNGDRDGRSRGSFDEQQGHHHNPHHRGQRPDDEPSNFQREMLNVVA